jgi:hypothetical protein
MALYDLFKVACADVNIDMCRDIKTNKELEGVLSNIGSYEFSKSPNGLFLFHNFVELVSDSSSFSNLETFTNLLLNSLSSMSLDVLSYGIRASKHDHFSDYIRKFKKFLASQIYLEEKMITSYIFINWLLTLYPSKAKFIKILKPHLSYDIWYLLRDNIDDLFEPENIDSDESSSDLDSEKEEEEEEDDLEDGEVRYENYVYHDNDTDSSFSDEEDEDY